MAKVYSYDAARTYSAEYIETDSTSLEIGDLVKISSGKVVAAGSDKPEYIVIGKKQADNKIPVAAILDDMILESDTAITEFVALGNNKYRKQ